MVRSRTWPAAELAAWLRALGDGAGLAGHARHVSDLVEGRAADCRCVDAKADAGRALARVRFQGLPESLGAAKPEAHRGSVEVPHRPYYAYEEILGL
ncbi:hypothetical protein [Streptomyces sp. NBC_00151]|uniref:hypothetical protein n=1 Tax=Streptomyces sp. NBC_00151 TaxID=2975669 RepID=UPI002DD9824F|nr:hypothetical protein [Streptomyces sp. NBC_00151]WRZ37268.1 hypothetical protein OG915_03855 [Streptomyces sp. NBC_00151]